MASQGGDSDLLEKLYPIPLSTGIASLPGPTSASARALLSVLKHNRQNYHIFFNERGFHNHVTHHVLAIYGLGASPEIIENAYGTHDYLKPAFESPDPITEKNFAEHLGDARYYSAYLAYFSEYLRDHTPNEAFERFIFSPSFNFNPDLAAAAAQDALCIPSFHLAYGFEFGIPGQVAEGLANTAVHPAEQTELVPPSFFSRLPEPGILSGLTSKFSLLRTDPVHGEKRPTFAFLRRIRDHPKLSLDALHAQLEEPRQNRYQAVVPKAGESIIELVEQWANGMRLEGMVEEVTWGNVIWFAVGGWQARGDQGRSFNADFFIAHLVTSAIFLLTLVLPSDHYPYPLVPLASRVTLLKAYLATSAYMQQPVPPDAKRKPLSAPGGPWERIIANCLSAHPEEHLPKAVRSLAVLAARWGSRPSGYFAGGGEDGLEGRETLDGTLFVRAASLALDRLGWAHESGKELGSWDFEGYTGRQSDDRDVAV
ncbi:hypothetical protein EDB89DRAFT_2072217 [Lactarius sanguifluus]|nr:hypothetical protein EDB89DRAFT_2072217 [Lactarius sanguifluus]